MNNKIIYLLVSLVVMSGLMLYAHLFPGKYSYGIAAGVSCSLLFFYVGYGVAIEAIVKSIYKTENTIDRVDDIMDSIFLTTPK